MQWRREWLIPAGGFVLVLLHHAAWYGTFPQYTSYPPDQAGYLAGGRAIFEGMTTLLREGPSAEVVEGLRRWFDFLGIAVVYGGMDFLRPNDLEFVRAVLAFFNALTAVGVYTLARQLFSPWAGGLALLFFTLSPAFPSGASRLYTDPITGCLIVWGLVFFVASEKRAFVGGLFLGSALFIRTQLLPWIPLALAVLSLTAWVRRRGDRDRLRRAWLGLSVPLVAVAVLAHFGLENLDTRAPKHNMPRYQYYAYGVWQYLDSDGWDGPWRLKTEPFYEALTTAAVDDPQLLTSRARQYLFAAGYLVDHRARAIPIILGNTYRFFDRPQNPEFRGFIEPELSIVIHRSAVLCALIGALFLWRQGGPGLAAPALVLIFSTLFSMAFVWPRYSMPTLPALLALAGVGACLLLKAIWDRRLLFGFVAVLTGTGIGLAEALRGGSPEAARWLLIASALAGVSGLIRFTFRGPELGRSVGFAVLVLGAVVVANAWRDRNWHQVDLDVRDGDVVRQETAIGPSALAQLRGAVDRYVAVDLELRHPSDEPWPITVNGIEAKLQPSIPPLPESIPVAEEGRAYPQWWVTPLTEEMLDRATQAGMAVVELAIRDHQTARLKADRFREQGTVFEGPSLGDWPRAVGTKPEYDRDFRLAMREQLKSSGTRTLVLREGQTISVRPVARIRLMALADREGFVAFEASGLPSSKPRRTGVSTTAVLGFAGRAVMGDRGMGSVWVNGEQAVTFPLAPFKNASWTNEDFTLCYRDRTPDKSQRYESRGLYLLSGPFLCPDGTCRVEVRFQPGMDDRPMGFSVETARAQPERQLLDAAAKDCGFETPVSWAFHRLIDGTSNSYPEDRGRWRVEGVY